MTDKPDKYGTLHVYPQSSHHTDVELVGDRNALEKLRDAITEALEKGSAREEHFFPNDGEGYGITVQLYDHPFGGPEWETLAVPYTYDYAQENDPRALYPMGKDKWFQLVEGQREFTTRMADFQEAYKWLNRARRFEIDTNHDVDVMLEANRVQRPWVYWVVVRGDAIMSKDKLWYHRGLIEHTMTPDEFQGTFEFGSKAEAVAAYEAWKASVAE